MAQKNHSNKLYEEAYMIWKVAGRIFQNIFGRVHFRVSFYHEGKIHWAIVVTLWPLYFSLLHGDCGLKYLSGLLCFV